MANAIFTTTNAKNANVNAAATTPAKKITAVDYKSMTTAQLLTEIECYQSKAAGARSNKSVDEAFILDGIAICNEARKKKSTVNVMQRTVLDYFKTSRPALYHLINTNMKEFQLLFRPNFGSTICVSHMYGDAKVSEYLFITWREFTDRTKEWSLADGYTIESFSFNASNCKSATVVATEDKPLTCDDFKYTTMRSEAVTHEQGNDLVYERVLVTDKNSGKSHFEVKRQDVVRTFYPALCGGTGLAKDTTCSDGRMFWEAFMKSALQLIEAKRNALKEEQAAAEKTAA